MIALLIELELVMILIMIDILTIIATIKTAINITRTYENTNVEQHIIV